MAFNGSGVFVRLYNWVNDAAAGVKIRADRMDAEMTGMATGLSTCITKDGQTTITANLPMAGFKHTGVGNASSRTEYASLGQVLDKLSYSATVGGTADVITLSNSIPFTSYVTGMVISFIAGGTNTTNVTVNVDGLGAKAITKNGSTALVAGDIPSGALIAAQYDGTRFQILTIPIPSNLVTTGGIQTLTNKTLTSPTINSGTIDNGSTVTLKDTLFTLQDDGDTTKQLKLQLSGITTGTTRTLTVPDVSGTIQVKSLSVVNRVLTASSGTYTPTSGMIYCIVEQIGGGGQGGSCTSATSAAAGGGGGGYAKAVFSAATIGASQSYTNGAGGTGASGSSTGNAGGNSTFGALITANGGSGGTGVSSAVAVAGGAGGTTTGGDLNIRGQSGHNGGSGSSSSFGGNGGSSQYGGGGRGGAVSGSGQSGQGYGSGGGGGAGATGVGGDGAAGITIVTEFVLS